jgi:thiamine-monophosphate kinase
VISGPGGRDWLVTVDALQEGVHFDLRWTDLPTLGRKAISVNLSDVAAMGGAPRFWLASVSVPRGMGEGQVGELFAGMSGRAREFGAVLVGGDTTRSSSGLGLSVTAIGEAPSGRAVLRGGARPGDHIFVTGELGGAELGLRCLRRGVAGDAVEPFVRRHCDPTPRVEEGSALCLSGMVSAMIDVSDGLMADVGHMADAAGLGFEIDAAAVPRPAGFESLCAELGLGCDELALGGGEDYELAFAVAGDRLAEFEREVVPRLVAGAARIGAMNAETGSKRAVRSGSPVGMKSLGFDHFGGDV